MKRFVSVLLVLVMMVMMVSPAFAVAPTVVAMGTSQLVAGLIGTAALLQLANNVAMSTEEFLEHLRGTASDELAKTNEAVQELAPYTSAYDDYADNETILRNYAAEHITVYEKVTTGLREYNEWMFDSVESAQRFSKAWLQMAKQMISYENLGLYIIEGVPGVSNNYQDWLGYPDSPQLTVNYPYQAIYQYNGTIEMVCSVNKLSLEYPGSKQIRSWTGTMWGGFIRYTLINGIWSNGYQLSYTYFDEILQANHDVYTDRLWTQTYFQQTNISDEELYIAPEWAYSETAAWPGGRSISLPGEATAADIITGQVAVSDPAVAQTITAEGTIPLTTTVADVIGAEASIPATANFYPDQWTVPTLITTKFPFCIPWDIKRMFESFLDDPLPPSWTVDLTEGIPGAVFTIDMAPFEPLAKIIRFFMYAGFLLALALNTKKVVPQL
jgi:hypothetical protein